MSVDRIQEILKQQGIWHDHLKLVPFEWLTEWAPAGALDQLEAYRLVDPQVRRRLDKSTRNWRPVLAVGDQVMIDPSPAMYRLILTSSGYFHQPENFDEDVLLQFHRFSFDFYQGYKVRETDFLFEGDALIVRGKAYRGLSESSFTTEARSDGMVNFKINE